MSEPPRERRVGHRRLPNRVLRLQVEQVPVGVAEREDLGPLGEDLDLAARLALAVGRRAPIQRVAEVTPRRAERYPIGSWPRWWL